MKTTSYEISKKLSKAGFGKGSAFAHFKNKCGREDIFYVFEGIKGGYEEEYFSYDLETILDALPAFIEHNNITYDLWVWNKGIGYYPNYDKYSGEGVYNKENSHIGYFLVDESLADTAGKMWLMLKEKGLIC